MSYTICPDAGISLEFIIPAIALLVGVFIGLWLAWSAGPEQKEEPK